MLLKLTVFISGASVMMLELIGARVLAPYLGTSIIVWTSLLGAVMASLSAGYYLGGKAADIKADYKMLAYIIFLAGISVGLVAILKSPILFLVQSQIDDIRWASLLGAFILFTPANIFLGAISMYAVKLYFSDSSRIGSTVGNLYAISTVGSIVGTYATGFFLISHFGNTNLLFSLAALLVFLSLFIYPVKITMRCLLVLALSAAPLFNSSLKYQFASVGFLDVDTKYNRVWILDSVDHINGRPVRTLSTGAHYIQSAMFLDPAPNSSADRHSEKGRVWSGAGADELVVEYTKFFDLVWHFNPDIEKTLMLGGGAYSYPKYFLSQNKDTEMDVAEIDPGLTELARLFFNLQDLPRLDVFHQDGRVDLNEGGVVAMNIVASIEGDTGKFLRAEYATYKLFSDYVYIFPVQEPENGGKIQNIILVAVKRPAAEVARGVEPQEYSYHLWADKIETDMPVLTDNFAPVDQYLVHVF